MAGAGSAARVAMRSPVCAQGSRRCRSPALAQPAWRPTRWTAWARPFGRMGGPRLRSTATVSGGSGTYPAGGRSGQTRIDEALKQASTPKAPAPVALPPAVSQSRLPPLQNTLPRGAPAQTEPRFDLVLIDAPIGQVLHAIVADTRYSILLSPRVAAPVPPVGGAQPDAASQA